MNNLSHLPVYGISFPSFRPIAIATPSALSGGNLIGPDLRGANCVKRMEAWRRLIVAQLLLPPMAMCEFLMNTNWIRLKFATIRHRNGTNTRTKLSCDVRTENVSCINVANFSYSHGRSQGEVRGAFNAFNVMFES